MNLAVDVSARLRVGGVSDETELFGGYESSDQHTNDLETCRKIFDESSSTYRFAVQVLEGIPRQECQRIAEDISTFYALVRVADEIVDGENRPESELAIIQIDELRRMLRDPSKAFEDIEEHTSGVISQQNKDTYAVIRANAVLFKRRGINPEILDPFFESMKEDVNGKYSYSNEDLDRYIHGSAGVIGWVMAYIFSDSERVLSEEEFDIVFSSSHHLGEAMQLTNILRDVFEDCRNLGRIYLPIEVLDGYGINRHDIETYSHMLRISPEFEQMMRYLIADARQMYRKAEIGIPYLSPIGQRMTRLGSDLYEAYLDKIEMYLDEVVDSGFEGVVPFKVRMTSMEKILVLARQL